MEFSLSSALLGVAVWAVASFLRLAGGVLQILFFVAVYVRPLAARMLVWLLGIRYPRAKTALLDQLDETLEEPNWQKRRADVLDGIGGMLAQARHLQRAERSSLTKTEENLRERPRLVFYGRTTITVTAVGFMEASGTAASALNKPTTTSRGIVSQGGGIRRDNEVSLDD